MAYEALNIAKYIIEKCDKDGCNVSNLQIQKILFFIQRDFLQKGKGVAFDERVEAWPYGPVVPNVYYNYCGYGGFPILWIKELDQFEGIDEADKKIIDNIIEEKRSKKPWELVNETHKEGGSWHRTYDNGKGVGNIIKPDLIKKYG